MRARAVVRDGHVVERRLAGIGRRRRARSASAIADRLRTARAVEDAEGEATARSKTRKSRARPPQQELRETSPCALPVSGSYGPLLSDAADRLGVGSPSRARFICVADRARARTFPQPRSSAVREAMGGVKVNGGPEITKMNRPPAARRCSRGPCCRRRGASLLERPERARAARAVVGVEHAGRGGLAALGELPRGLPRARVRRACSTPACGSARRRGWR